MPSFLWIAFEFEVNQHIMSTTFTQGRWNRDGVSVQTATVFLDEDTDREQVDVKWWQKRTFTEEMYFLLCNFSNAQHQKPYFQQSSVQ